MAMARKINWFGEGWRNEWMNEEKHPFWGF